MNRKNLVKLALVTAIVFAFTALSPLNLVADADARLEVCDVRDCCNHEYEFSFVVQREPSSDWCADEFGQRVEGAQYFSELFGLEVTPEDVTISSYFIIESYYDLSDDEIELMIAKFLGEASGEIEIVPFIWCVFGLNCDWGAARTRTSSATHHSRREVRHPASGRTYLTHNTASCWRRYSYRVYCNRCTRTDTIFVDGTPICCNTLKTTWFICQT